MPGKLRASRGEAAKLRGPENVPIQLKVNGQEREIHVEPRRTLLDALREDLGLAGTKKGCDEGTCGACTVLADGRAIYACMVLAIECEGKSIETIESLEKEGILHPIQTAFVEEDGFQCGFCTPGQIMSVKALLDSNPHPEIGGDRAANGGKSLPVRSVLGNSESRPKGRRALAEEVGR